MDLRALGLRRVSAANGGLLIKNESTGTGWERVLTTSDSGGGTAPEIKYCTTDSTVNNSETLVDVTGLTGFTLDTSGLYAIDGSIHMISNATADHTFAFEFTNTEQGGNFSMVRSTTGAAGTRRCSVSPSTQINLGAPDTNEAVAQLTGYVQANATTGGTMDFQFAQNTATVVDTIVYAGSWIRLTKIA